tara:strand:- start:9 stop:482 length:474 start_codon:yes stop_codon:yes gene_type:complete
LLREGQEIPTTYTVSALDYSSNYVSVSYEVNDITFVDGQKFLLTLTDTAGRLLFRDKMQIGADNAIDTSSFTFIADELSEDEYTILDINSSGGDKNFIHHQSSANATWNVNHNLGKFTSVTVVDSGNTVVQGQIVFVDPNNITLIFSSAFSGRAYFN